MSFERWKPLSRRHNSKSGTNLVLWWLRLNSWFHHETLQTGFCLEAMTPDAKATSIGFRQHLVAQYMLSLAIHRIMFQAYRNLKRHPSQPLHLVCGCILHGTYPPRGDFSLGLVTNLSNSPTCGCTTHILYLGKMVATFLNWSSWSFCSFGLICSRSVRTVGGLHMFCLRNFLHMVPNIDDSPTHV